MKRIAIYHCSIKIISWGKGRSAVAAAYRAAEIIQSAYNGVAHREILLPEHTPEEYKDRATLWNAVEMAERNSTESLSAIM